MSANEDQENGNIDQQYIVPAKARLKIGLRDENDDTEDLDLLPMVETANNMVNTVIRRYANDDHLDRGSAEYTSATQAAEAKFLQLWYLHISNAYREGKYGEEYEARIDNLIVRLKSLFGPRVRPSTAHRSYRAPIVMPSQKWASVWDY